jgi:hypothetical protein
VFLSALAESWQRAGFGDGRECDIWARAVDFHILRVGPDAHATIQKIADEPQTWTNQNFPFAALRNLTIKGVPVLAFRISYVGEQGWELHFKYEDGQICSRVDQGNLRKIAAVSRGVAGHQDPALRLGMGANEQVWHYARLCPLGNAPIRHRLELGASWPKASAPEECSASTAATGMCRHLGDAELISLTVKD